MTERSFRIERDTLGEVRVPADALWGAETQRALENFRVGNEQVPREVIHALALVKKGAAAANRECGVLDERKARAIAGACDEVMSGSLDAHFPLPIWQSGSGTQSNMNVNEVIAARANEALGVREVHPKDDVNRSQSTNDVFPAAMHISAYKMLCEHTLPGLKTLEKALAGKSAEFAGIVKTGRTHFMDAVPVTLGQEFSAYASQVSRAHAAVQASLQELLELPLGGTAVGTGLNAPPGFAEKAVGAIADITGIPFIPARNRFEALACHDALVSASGALKRGAAALMKITGDIRFMASGPRCGIGEIILPENEPGSSIMPGKSNPTQAEMTAMVCAQIMGNDAAIAIGGMSGNLELNVFKPLIIWNFLRSARLMGDAASSLAVNCIAGIEPARENIREHLDRSLMLATALTPRMGYDRAAEISRKARLEGITLREAAVSLGYLTKEEYDLLMDPEKMV